MQKQILQSSIEEKNKKIQLLQVILRGISAFQEKKNSKNEKQEAGVLEESLKNL